MSTDRRTILKATGAAAMAATLAPKRARAADPDVIVIGAGLSGLYAAMLLEESSATVQVIEGRDRIGGRLFSARHVEGNPEWGGDSVLGGYGRMQDTAARVGVELVDHQARRDLTPEAHEDPTSTELALRGKLIPKGEWPAHALNKMPDGAKSRFPGRGYYQSIIAENNPLEAFEDWLDPESAQFDTSIYDFFKSVGWSDEAIDLNYNINVQYGTSAHDISALMWFYTQAWFKLQSDIDRVAFKAPGGNQSIPEAMAAFLKGEVHLGKEVVGVRSEPGHAEVHCKDGSVYKAKRVICSMPIPTMRWVKWDPLLPPNKLKAIHTVPVQKVTKVILVPTAPFWEDDGFSPAMWTDSECGEVRALREGEDANRITCLMAWARGHLADRLDVLGEGGAQQRVLDAYTEIRPAAKGKLEMAGVKSWQTDRFTAGDWAVFAPGQVTESVPGLMQPADRIHFCGEHTATSNRGMEGAMESGERAAFEALDLI